jgi:heat shock protein HslJ
MFKKDFVILKFMVMKLSPKIKRMTIQFILAVLFAPLITSCSKDKQTIIKNDWQVESIKIHSDSALKFPVNTYILSFENKRKYSIKLDVNSCFGKVDFKSNNKIEFKSDGCTKICCDSDFAKSIIDILAKVNHYNVSDTNLILTGEDGEIINLKRK